MPYWKFIHTYVCIAIHVTVTVHALYNVACIILHCWSGDPSRKQLNVPCAFECNPMVAMSSLTETEPYAKKCKQSYIFAYDTWQNNGGVKDE